MTVAYTNQEQPTGRGKTAATDASQAAAVASVSSRFTCGHYTNDSCKQWPVSHLRLRNTVHFVTPLKLLLPDDTERVVSTPRLALNTHSNITVLRPSEAIKKPLKIRLSVIFYPYFHL